MVTFVNFDVTYELTADSDRSQPSDFENISFITVAHTVFEL